ncbi:DUF2280 domain-containing protein [Acinetobacter radioresistens]|uniref:DUF2280 domain-containing protein n=1 Tax=Acinetobacter radioresistens TaxID=40216 RepID=UPI002004FBC0|nr:DUF2280 domain-containing protein [Acinetobacter radioresistens]MCK4077518.1 DUF2280 domain-containing protein [Acinetobacter radioresistens]
MATLNKKQKLFIVRSLAQFNTPQETVVLVKEEFNIDVSRQQCEAYDPTKRVGKDLSDELKTEFESTRKDFLEKPQNIPIANLTVRLQRLENQYQKHGKNRVAALNILKQAAEDMGGKYTNRQEITGKDGKPIETINQNVPTDSYLKAREQVLDEY